MLIYSYDIGEHTSTTAHLSGIEDGYYRRLMDRYFIAERPLPLDEVDLFRLVRAYSDEDKVAARSVLHEFFTHTDNGWLHQHCDLKIGTYRKRREKLLQAANRRRAKASIATADEKPALKRDEQDKTNPKKQPGNDQCMPGDTHTLAIANLPPVRSKPKASASRLPKNWRPDADDIAFCEATHPGVKVDEMGNQFRDYWIGKAGRDACKLDWSATWRNWVRNHRVPSQGYNRSQQQPFDLGTVQKAATEEARRLLFGDDSAFLFNEGHLDSLPTQSIGCV